jgi:hypothetical protein
VGMAEDDNHEYLQSKLADEVDFELEDIEDPEYIRKEYNRYHSRKLKRVLETASEANQHSQISIGSRMSDHVKSHGSGSEEMIFQGFLYKFNKLGGSKFVTKW